MTDFTFTLSPAPEVPPTAIFSASPDANDDAYGVIETPAGWPTSGLCSALEVDLTTVTALTGDAQVAVGVSTDDSLIPISGLPADGGTWSGADGATGAIGGGGVEAYYLDKFGGWRTDYVSVSNGASSGNKLSVTFDSSHLLVGDEIDVQALVRVADWDAGIAGHGGTIYNRQGQFELRRTATGMDALIYKDSGGPSYATVPWATLGWADNTWQWIRCTTDGTNGVRFWTSADGNSWSVVHTTALSFTYFPTTSTSPDKVGNGNNLSGIYGSGFGGDIAQVFMATSVGGTPVIDLSLDQMESSSDTSWDNPPSSQTWTNDGGPTVTGETVSGSATVALEFDTETEVSEWRLFVWVQSGTGEVSVDEIRLVVDTGGGFIFHKFMDARRR